MITPMLRSLTPITLLALTLSVSAHPIMVDDRGLAINGYDTVAYHTQDEAIVGSADYEVQWEDITWRFSSAEHRDLFAEDPERYVPNYGSHCANAMSNGDKVDANPEVYRIIDGELYLYAQRWGALRWRVGVESQIDSANEHWARFRQDLGYD